MNLVAGRYRIRVLRSNLEPKLLFIEDNRSFRLEACSSYRLSYEAFSDSRIAIGEGMPVRIGGYSSCGENYDAFYQKLLKDSVRFYQSKEGFYYLYN